MLEQSTMKEALTLAQSWGPVGTCFVVFFMYQIWSNFQTKKKSIDPIVKIWTELEKRVPYDWVEEKLEKYQSKEVANAHYDALVTAIDDVKRDIGHIRDSINGKH